MKKINFKYINISAWIVLLLAYVFPVNYMPNVGEGGGNEIGFPLRFFTIYQGKNDKYFFSFSNLNLGSLIVNIAIIYICIVIFRKLFKFIKNKKITKNI